MTVPDEAQDVLSKVAVLTPKDAERLMQSAASRLGNARDGFQLAKKARQNLHKNWWKFVVDAVTRWQKHSENFSKEDAKLEEAIMAAANVFQAARAHLEETKEALAGVRQPGGANSGDFGRRSHVRPGSPNLSGEIQQIVHNLTHLRDHQGEQADQSASKKPRVEQAQDGSGGAPVGCHVPCNLFQRGANRPKGGLPAPIF